LQAADADQAADVLLLCQHNPVYTLGRRLQVNDIDAKRLELLGADYYKASLMGMLLVNL
jgi:lipoate-protein ligase B